MDKGVLTEVRNFAECALERLELIDTTKLAARKLDREAMLVSETRRWLDQLMERAKFWEGKDVQADE